MMSDYVTRRGSWALRGKAIELEQAAEPRRCRCCGVEVKVGMLACRNHWFVLPLELRNAILLTYRGGDKKAYVENVRQAEKVWRELGVQR